MSSKSDWRKYLCVGQTLDVKLSEDIWKIGTITTMRGTSFRIHYEYHDGWIAKSSDRLAPLHTHTVNVMHLSKPSPCIETCSPPLYYKPCKGRNDYMIITMNKPNCRNVNDGHILKYDNTNDTYDIIQYPQNIYFKSHCSCMNNETGDIYIYCNVDKLFMTYNIVTSQWNMITLACLSELFQTKMIYIPSPFEQIHLFGITNDRRACHFVYHLQRNQLIGLNSFSDKFNEHLTNFDLIFIAFQQRLMLLGGIDTDTFGMNATSNSIWTFEVHQEYDDDGNIWYLYGVELPHKSVAFTSTIAFKHTVFVFYFKSVERKEIWCLDLLHEEWRKCNKIYPLKYEESATKTYSNYVHFIYCGYMAFHVKISLQEFIPESLLEVYTNYYVQFISIYSRYVLENVEDRIVPDGLKHIIMRFYPLWL